VLHARFYRVAAGAIGAKSDEEPMRRLLQFLALVQPFEPESKELISAVASLERIERHELSRLMRLLREGGVIFKRGGLYRISPDLLADVIVENACIGAEGASTEYAECVFDLVEGNSVEHVITNLGRLDWRRSEGASSQSRLLDGIWNKLRPEHEYGDPHLKAVTAVAYYQPDRALSFATDLIRRGEFLRQVPEILKYVGYNHSHLREACECLWRVGRDDPRETNPHPEHAIQILRELCEVKPNKPREFTDTVVDFGLSLLGDAGSWTGKHTPLEFIGAALETDGHTSRWSKRAVTFRQFGINLEFVRPIRSRVIDALYAIARRNDLPRAALRCTQMLGQALRYPMNEPNREKWDAEFARTFDLIEMLLHREGLASVVGIQALEAVSWHARYNKGPSHDRAEGIAGIMPHTLEFRTTLGWLTRTGIFRGNSIMMITSTSERTKRVSRLSRERSSKRAGKTRLRPLSTACSGLLRATGTTPTVRPVGSSVRLRTSAKQSHQPSWRKRARVCSVSISTSLFRPSCR
jgi:hypothetical protein